MGRNLPMTQSSSPTLAAPRLLLVEDDLRIRRELVDALEAAGYAVEVTASFAAARAALDTRRDLVLLDLGLPDGDGLDLCRELRRTGSGVPILILSARDQPEQRVRGLDVGADDYIVKPFNLPELLARVRSALRRSGGAASPARLGVGELWLDRESRRVGRGELRVQLKPREFDLLEFLLQHPGRAWTRDQLLARVWGPGYDGDARTVDSHVRRLRAQIEADPADPVYIETVWGVGYRMRETAPGEELGLKPGPTRLSSAPTQSF
jgi:two-component system response regulator ResD